MERFDSNTSPFNDTDAGSFVKVFVQDLDSSNGTYINGVKLASGQPKQLNTGDILVR